MDDSDLPANSSLPLPPPFYKSFTKENITELSELFSSKLAAVDVSSPFSARQLLTSSDIPSHLTNLVPPPLPTNGKYTIFSTPTQFPPLKTPLPPETAKLYDKPSPSELLTLSRSVFLNYIELVDILVRNPDPSNWGPKWDDLRDLLRNCHDVCGEYREWALKRQVRVYMEGVLAKTERERENFEGMVKKMEGLEQEIKEGRKKQARDEEGLVNGHGDEQDHVMNGKNEKSEEMMEIDEVWAEVDGD